MKNVIKLLIALTVFGIGYSQETSAQQPQQTPAQTALQINNVIGQWAQIIESQQQEIAKLKAEIEKLKKEKPDAK